VQEAAPKANGAEASRRSAKPAAAEEQNNDEEEDEEEDDAEEDDESEEDDEDEVPLSSLDWYTGTHVTFGQSVGTDTEQGMGIPGNVPPASVAAHCHLQCPVHAGRLVVPDQVYRNLFALLL
jgi:hypothetical protein